MFKNSKPYLLATILIVMGLANLFRSLDAVHHTITQPLRNTIYIFIERFVQTVGRRYSNAVSRMPAAVMRICAHQVLSLYCAMVFQNVSI